jgi:uncharacterized protein YdaL
MEDDRNHDFREMSHSIMRCYQDVMHNYLISKEAGKLTDADVATMVMNLTIGISTNIYYTLKQFLPNTTLDFDYMRAKMINALSDAFEQIKEYVPEEKHMPLTMDQVKEILTNGFAIIKMPDGSDKRITENEILVAKADKEKLLEEARKEAKNVINTPKIITESGTPF